MFFYMCNHTQERQKNGVLIQTAIPFVKQFKNLWHKMKLSKCLQCLEKSLKEQPYPEDGWA